MEKILDKIIGMYFDAAYEKKFKETNEKIKTLPIEKRKKIILKIKEEKEIFINNIIESFKDNLESMWESTIYDIEFLYNIESENDEDNEDNEGWSLC